MSLSETEKQKIKEEEEFRASVRENLKEEPKTAKKKRGLGCLNITLITASVIIILSIAGSTYNQVQSPTGETRESFKASVEFTGTQFIITSLDDLNCENAKMSVNGTYSLNGYEIEAGNTYTVGAGQFTKKDGTRLNTFTVKPKDFNIYCSTIGATNALSGKGWYGKFE